METGNLGSFVAQRRKTLGFSQIDLANAVHYTGQAISSFEKGDTSPSISVLPSLANFLKLSLDDLLSQNPNPESLKEDNPPFDGTIVCANLVALRKQNGYSQSQEGKLLGVSRRTIIHYENGSSIPSLITLETLLSTYHLSCSDFFYHFITGASPKQNTTNLSKFLSIFAFGFLLGGGLLSAILVPVLTLSSQNANDSSSSGAYQVNSSNSNTSEDSSISNSSSSSASTSHIPGLTKLVIITTSGAARSTGLTVGGSTALTLYTEGTFDFTDKTPQAYTLQWSLIDYQQDISGVHLSETSPYPCELLSADSTQKAGPYFSVSCRLVSLTDPTRYCDAVSIDVTIYGA
jgi:transcriptional regulator with XRE-family HTH domain